MRKKIYIAGPMSLGDRVANLAQALAAFRALMLAGFAPFCPQLTFLVEAFVPATHQDWLAADLPWVACSDAVLRLPGTSLGADKEVAFAEARGIPVFESLEALTHHFGVRDHGN